MKEILTFIVNFIENIFNFLISIFEFLHTFLIEFPIFLARFFSSLPQFIQTGVILIICFYSAMLVLKVISLIRESTV